MHEIVDTFLDFGIVESVSEAVALEEASEVDTHEVADRVGDCLRWEDVLWIGDLGCLPVFSGRSV